MSTKRKCPTESSSESGEKKSRVAIDDDFFTPDSKGGSEVPEESDSDVEMDEKKGSDSESESESESDPGDGLRVCCLDDEMMCLDQCVPDFCSGVLRAAPRIQVAGFGALRYPLSEADCVALHACGKPSAFGQGEQTITDSKVRSSREYPASALTINPNKCPLFEQEFEQEIVETATELFKQGTLTLTPQKLVVYAPGDFFKVHKDTVRGDTHVGTIVISLPVDGGFTGGTFALQTSTGTKFMTGDNFSSRGLEANFACFRTDVDHEVHPVESGYRVVLSYEVFGSEKRPQSLAEPKMREALTTIHATVEGGLELLHKVIILTEHKYTQRTAVPEKLHGADRIVFDYMTGKGYDVRVNTVDLEHGCYEDDSDEMTISGKDISLTFPYDEDEEDTEDCTRARAAVLSTVFNSPGETISENHGGLTGNESAPSEYHYRHTALVFVNAENDKKKKKPSA